MNVQEALDIMQSDMKLWEAAETEETKEGVVIKTISLPWGLGEVVVELEGMNDGNKRREAVESYGAYIRGLIDEQTNDEAITARAKAAAARAKPDDSPDGSGVDPVTGVQHTTGEAEAVQATGHTYAPVTEEHADFGASLIARESALLERVGRTKADLARWEQELTGIEAALNAMGYTR